MPSISKSSGIPRTSMASSAFHFQILDRSSWIDHYVLYSLYSRFADPGKILMKAGSPKDNRRPKERCKESVGVNQKQRYKSKDCPLKRSTNTRCGNIHDLLTSQE